MKYENIVKDHLCYSFMEYYGMTETQAIDVSNFIMENYVMIFRRKTRTRKMIKSGGYFG